MKKITLFIAVIVLSVSCRDVAAEKAAEEKAKQATVDSMKMVMEKQRVVDSMKTVMAQQEAEKQQAANSAPTAEAPKKKGMSSTAKGALIGAGVGAVTGAVVSKKKGEGAIIGGVAGAAVGAGTGAIIDSKKKK